MDCSLNLAKALGQAVDASLARFASTRQDLFSRLSSYFHGLQASQPVYFSEETITVVIYLHYLLARITVKPKKQCLSFGQSNATLFVVVSEYLKELRTHGYRGQLREEKSPQTLRFCFESALNCLLIDRRVYAICYEMHGFADAFLISKLVADIALVAPDFREQISWRGPLLDHTAFFEMFEARQLEPKRLQRDIVHAAIDPTAFAGLMEDLEAKLPLLITKSYKAARKKLIKALMNCLGAFSATQRPRVLTVLNRLISKNLIFDSHIRPENVLIGDSSDHFSRIFNAQKLVLVVCSRLKTLNRCATVYHWSDRLQDVRREIYGRSGVFEVAQFDNRGRPGRTYRVFSAAESAIGKKLSSSVSASLSESELGTTPSVSGDKAFSFDECEVRDCNQVELFSHKNSRATLCLDSSRHNSLLHKCFPHAMVGCLEQSAGSSKLLFALIAWVKRVSRLEVKKRMLLKNIPELFRFARIESGSYAQVSEALQGSAQGATASFEQLFGRGMHHPALVAIYGMVMRKRNAVSVEGDSSHLTLGFKAVLSQFGDNSLARKDNYDYLNFLSSELYRRVRNIPLSHNVFLPANSALSADRQSLLGTFSHFIARHFPLSLVGRHPAYLFSKHSEATGDRVLYLPVLIHNIQFNNDIIGACRFAREETRLVFHSMVEGGCDIFFGLKLVRQALREHGRELTRRQWVELRGREQTLYVETYHFLHNTQRLSVQKGDNCFELRFLDLLPQDAPALLSADCFRREEFDRCNYACVEQFFAKGASTEGLEELLTALGVCCEADVERMLHLPQIKLQRSRVAKLRALLERRHEPAEERTWTARQVSQLAGGRGLGPIAILTPEFGEFVKKGGLAVIIDDMAKELAELGEEVHVFMPCFSHARYQKVFEAAGFARAQELKFPARDSFYELEVFELCRPNLRFYLLKNGNFWEDAYVSHNRLHTLKQVGVFCRAAMALMVDRGLRPAIVLTNDWFAGLAAAYKKIRLFGAYFDEAVFVHVVHNLGSDYQGKLFLDWCESGEYFASAVELPCEFLFDQHSNSKVINPSHCALLCSDQWGTVSKSYRAEILAQSEMGYLLQRYPAPFAYPNGVRGSEMQAKFDRLPAHGAQKRQALSSYFGVEVSEAALAQNSLFGFIGRISEQKGVMLILEAIEEVLAATSFRAFFVIAGPIDNSEYSVACAEKLLALKRLYPKNVWGEPYQFFNDGPALTRAADYILMPSLFEPGGIVQHEAFFAGTPVIAFRTGGLKDAVRSFSRATGEGNGLLFEHHRRADLLHAMMQAHELAGDECAYARMRENARKSYIDIKDVVRAWRGEFYRLGGLPHAPLEPAAPPPPQPAKTISLADPYAAHFYVGMRTSRDAWATEHALRFNAHAHCWETDIALGDCDEYKLFVDGVPWADLAQPVLITPEGYTNNVFFPAA